MYHSMTWEGRSVYGSGGIFRKPPGVSSGGSGHRRLSGRGHQPYHNARDSCNRKDVIGVFRPTLPLKSPPQTCLYKACLGHKRTSTEFYSQNGDNWLKLEDLTEVWTPCSLRVRYNIRFRLVCSVIFRHRRVRPDLLLDSSQHFRRRIL